MTDLVERLRAYKSISSYGSMAALFGEAADEIEKLRAQMESGNYLTENDKLSLGIERQALEIKALHDEIERLRAQVVALQSSLEVGKREGKKTP